MYYQVSQILQRGRKFVSFLGILFQVSIKNIRLWRIHIMHTLWTMQSIVYRAQNVIWTVFVMVDKSKLNLKPIMTYDRLVYVKTSEQTTEEDIALNTFTRLTSTRW